MTSTRERTESLARAAAAAGIFPSYSDAFGRARHAGPKTILACLAAMGFKTDEGGLDQLEEEITSRLRTAPRAVVSYGSPWRLRMTSLQDAGPCMITTEDGAAIAGSLSGDGSLMTHVNPPLGYHRLSLASGREIELAICPERAYWPDWMYAGERRWGVAAQIYSLRGSSDDEMGDFEDLAELVQRIGENGGDAVLINPVAAAFPWQPHRKSPYQASDRRFLNPVMIDTGPGRDGGATIDYTRAVPARLAAMRRQYAEQHESARQEFARWAAQASGAFRQFAAWQAGAMAAPGESPEAEVDFHLWLQWQADEQLARSAQAARRTGMSIGLIRDLPVGPAQDGFETLSQRGIYAEGIDIGAPPDPLAPGGQNWGIAGFNPLALQTNGYDVFIALVRSNMRHAGALRIDHVMSLCRLYWIPRGGDEGAYVSYPLDELLSLLCLESVRARCLVIGEDLGTVPEGFRENLRGRGILGTQVVQFERSKDGALYAPGHYRYESLCQISTHDMPTFAAWWKSAEAADRRRFSEALRDFIPQPALPLHRDRLGFRAAFLRVNHFLGETASALALVRLEDVALERRAINVPGTGDEHGNWSLRLRLKLSELLSVTTPSRGWNAVVSAMQISRAREPKFP